MINKKNIFTKRPLSSEKIISEKSNDKSTGKATQSQHNEQFIWNLLKIVKNTETEPKDKIISLAKLVVNK